MAILFALFSSDATRDIIVNAKASIAAVAAGAIGGGAAGPARG